ncbi:hypothetical protein KKA14_20560 [bacterium]|nr:hypothetical protein [bacterium]
MNRIIPNRKKRGTAAFILLLLISLLVFVGCETEKEPGKNDLSTSDIAENMVNAVGTSMDATMDGMLDSVLNHVKSCATSQLITGSLLNSTDSAAISAAIAKGMMKGLGDYPDDQLYTTAHVDATVTSPNKKIAIGIIVYKLTSELTQFLSGGALKTAVGNVVKIVTGAFNTAGIEGEDMRVIANRVIADTIKGLNDKGLDDETILAISPLIIQSAIAGIGDDLNDLSSDSLNISVEEVVSNLVSSLGAIGISQESIVTKMPDIISGAILGIGEADVEVIEYPRLSGSVKNGFVAGLQQIGMTNGEINDVFSDIESACATALSDLIVNNPEPIVLNSLIDTITSNLGSIDSATSFTLTESQKVSIKSGLEAAISSASLSNSNDLEKLFPIIIEGAAKSIAVLIPSLTDDQKVDVYRNILESCEQYLIGRESGEGAIEMLEIITESSLTHLNEMSVSSINYMSALENIADSLIKSLDEIPLGDKSISDAAPAIVGMLIGTVDTLGLLEVDKPQAIKSIVSGAVAGVDLVDLNTNELNELIGKISEKATNNAIKNELDAGKTDEALIDSVEDITKSVLDGLAAAGVSTSDCANMADDIIQGAASELSKVLTADDLSDALTKGVNGIMSGLDEAGATDEEKAAAESAAINAVDSAVSNTADPTKPKLIISDEKLMTEEGSVENGSFKVSLDKKPTETIAVSIVSKDTTEGTVSPPNLLFNSTNWNKAQDVFINPVDEGYVDGEIKYQIVVTTDGGDRKTLQVTNMDNDKVGINVTPSNKQYTSEVGGQAWYYVSLTSQPDDNITLRWAINTGKDSIFFNPNGSRILTFTPLNYAIPQMIILQGKTCGTCLEHATAVIESQNIISVNGTDVNYPELSPKSISLVNLKNGPVIMTTDAINNNVVEVDFDGSKVDFSNDDDNFIYETVFTTESIAMTYAKYQSRPLLIKEDVCFNGDNVDLHITTIPASGEPLPIPESSSFTFCIKFYNANTSQTTYGMSSWATANSFSLVGSCSGIGDTPDYVTCQFSGSGSSLPTSTIPANTIFSDDKVGNDSYFLLGGSGYDLSPPTISPQPIQPSVTLNYKPLTIVGTRTARFNSSSNLQSGFWYLSNKSKSFILGSSTYSSSNYHYIFVP